MGKVGDIIGIGVETDVDGIGVERRRRRVEFGDGRGVGGACFHALFLLPLLRLYRLA